MADPNAVYAVVGGWATTIGAIVTAFKVKVKKDEQIAIDFANKLEQQASTILTAIQKLTPPPSTPPATPPAAGKK